MIWIIIFLVGCLAMLLFMNHHLREDNLKQEAVIADLQDKFTDTAYYQLEKGMDEQQESFEQEYLTWAEKEANYKLQIEAKDALIEELDADNAEYREMLSTDG